MTTAAISRRGRAESDQLTRALLNIAARGLRTHCSDPTLSELWLSEHEAERAEACRLCTGCPVERECYEVGKFQTWGCWGGVDRSVRPGKKKPTATPQDSISPAVLPAGPTQAGPYLPAAPSAT
jgi:hypothetical protein